MVTGIALVAVARARDQDGIVQDQLLYAILQGEAALGDVGLETAAP